MTTYVAPIADMRRVIKGLVAVTDVAALWGLGDAPTDLVDAVLEETGNASNALAALNRTGDVEGTTFSHGLVTTTLGW